MIRVQAIRLRREPPRIAESCIGGRRSRALVAALGLALGLAIGCTPGEGDDGNQAQTPRDPAPEFSLMSLDGTEISMQSLRGKTVVIDFWATWCPPCEFQVPALNEFWNNHKGGGDLAVLGVSVDTEGPEVVAAWVEEKGVDYPILMGDESLARAFGALGFPALVVVGPDGRISFRHMGLIEMEELEEVIALESETRG